MRPGGGERGLVLPAILLVLGFLVTAALVQERAHEERRPAQSAELVELVGRRQAAIADLATDVRNLSAELLRVQEAGARESGRVRAALDRVDSLRLPAGVEPARGPGVVVELADSPEAPQTRGEVTDLRIHDVDLQLVVNALWAAGAEAVSVNGRRVVATTAIRKAGDAIQVNFHAVSSPYRVAAIGDPEALRRRMLASEIGRQFEVWTQIYGLGFSVRTAGTLVLPAPPASGGLVWARPAEEAR